MTNLAARRLPDGTEVEIAAIICETCGIKVPNYPEETENGWRLMCPNHHEIIVTTYPRGWSVTVEDPVFS